MKGPRMADFDKIITSSPVNAQAARQLGRGVDFVPQKYFADVLKDRPLLKHIGAECANDPGFFDFTGMVFGRLTVLGIMEKTSVTPTSWACKCKCGNYTTRKSKSLKVAMQGGSLFRDRCGECEYVQWISSPEYKSRG